MPASVYLGNLPPGISKDDIFSQLSVYGSISAIDLLQGYGFVEFSSESDAMDVVNIFSSQPLLGAWVKVQIARNRRRRSGGGNDNKLYRSPSPRRERSTSSQYTRSSPDQPRMRFPVTVHNLSRATCWQELKDFGRLAGGTVAYCDIDKKNRGRGFIEYLTREDAEAAMRELSGKDLNGNVVTVTSVVTQRGRSRSRSPVRPRDRDPAGRHPHPYSNARFPSDPYNYGRQRYRDYDDEPRAHFEGHMPSHEGQYTASPSWDHNYGSRDTWDTQPAPYGGPPPHTDIGQPSVPQSGNLQPPYGSVQHDPSFDEYYRKILDVMHSAQVAQTPNTHG